MQIRRFLCRFTGAYADSQVPMQNHRCLCRFTGAYTDSQVSMQIHSTSLQIHRYLCRLTGTYANSQVSPYMRRGMYHPELAVAACVRRGLAVLRGLSLPVLPTMDDARGCLRHGLWQCHNLLPRLTHRCCLGLAAIHSHQLHRRHAHLVDAPIGGVAGGGGPFAAEPGGCMSCFPFASTPAGSPSSPSPAPCAKQGNLVKSLAKRSYAL